MSAQATVATADGTPDSVAAAVAIATELAKATGTSGQAALAAQADRISGIPADWIVPCLAAFADATPAGGNWLRSGIERAVERAGDSLSADSLMSVVAERKQPARVRTLAFGWLKDRDPSRAAGLLDGMLDDPALDLRREAVETLARFRPRTLGQASRLAGISPADITVVAMWVRRQRG